jgi:hypothetical protein
MAANCETCGRGLSLSQRARGRKQCDSCLAEAQAVEARTRAEAEAEAAEASAQYREALIAVVSTGGTAESVNRVRTLERAMVAGGSDPSKDKATYYRSYLDHALADEVLTEDEERVVDQIGNALYADAEDAQLEILRDYRVRLFIAMANDGRLPSLPASGMLLKKGETLHLVASAALMKEVVHKEYRSGSRGYSFRIAKGVSYRVGASRGQMVEVGRSLEVADSGTLSMTSHRAVFTGERKTVEMPYAKLLDMNVYTDGVQFHLSGRQNPSMFRVESGEMVAAIVNTASQRLMQ